MRYTNKSDKFVNAYEWNRDLPTKTFVQLGMNKLGQLEDIEDDLGIDLVTLFKALKNGIYIKNQSQIKYPLALLRQHYSNHTTKYYVFDNGKEKIIKMKDYGKKWALTKEELE